MSNITKVVNTLVSNQKLDSKYRNHKLINNVKYNDCYECHLIYQIRENELLLLLAETGSHSDLF